MTPQYLITFRAMGSQFHVWLETGHDGNTILRQVPGWVEAIEARLSRFRPESELNYLNAHSGKWVKVSDTLLNATIKAYHAAEVTDGLCNPLILPALIAAGYTHSFDKLGKQIGATDSDENSNVVPSWRGIEIKRKNSAIRLLSGAKIDLGGTAKGWSAEIIANRLDEYGPCLVDAGGDLVARGKPQGLPGWQVDIAEPGTLNLAPIGTIVLTDATVATSGVDFRRWYQNGKPQHHLIDPRTGQPAITDVQTSTVIHSMATLAEAYAKAVILLGSQAGLDWINRQPQKTALVVRNDGAVLATSNFESKLLALV